LGETEWKIEDKGTQKEKLSAVWNLSSSQRHLLQGSVLPGTGGSVVGYRVRQGRNR